VSQLFSGKDTVQPINNINNLNNNNFNINNNNSNNRSVVFCFEAEKRFFEGVVSDDEQLKSLSVVLNIDPPEIKNRLDVFLNDVSLRKYGHKDATDFVTHFRFWCEKKQRDSASSKQTDNDKSDKQQQSARKGTEISNKPYKDYKNSAF
jgi:hypothetical protein